MAKNISLQWSCKTKNYFQQSLTLRYLCWSKKLPMALYLHKVLSHLLPSLYLHQHRTLGQAVCVIQFNLPEMGVRYGDEKKIQKGLCLYHSSEQELIVSLKPQTADRNLWSLDITFQNWLLSKARSENSRK